ncbi:MAG: hypothetical protein P4L51_22650 [Puia sp.]|nr:hypothetical protein [Puia sp.]
MILRFNYEFIEHPYKDESSSRGEKWAKFGVMLLDANGNPSRDIFRIQWDIIVFLEWVTDNKEALLSEELPSGIEDYSIARSIFEFYENVDPDSDDDLLDAVYSYRQKHGLRFALRGVDIDEIYIGKFDGVMTVSFYKDDDEQYSSNVEVDSFFTDVQYCIEKIGTSMSS